MSKSNRRQRDMCRDSRTHMPASTDCRESGRRAADADAAPPKPPVPEKQVQPGTDTTTQDTESIIKWPADTCLRDTENTGKTPAGMEESSGAEECEEINRADYLIVKKTVLRRAAGFLFYLFVLAAAVYAAYRAGYSAGAASTDRNFIMLHYPSSSGSACRTGSCGV